MKELSPKEIRLFKTIRKHLNLRDLWEPLENLQEGQALINNQIIKVIKTGQGTHLIDNTDILLCIIKERTIFIWEPTKLARLLGV